ncbi:MAG TPA: efflux RND transporter periplasmic adaptor subunit [Cytophagales bacterium]|nr:efflux RND transporter periplasmic adaptor subunit [Cytophagales bacterium]
MKNYIYPFFAIALLLSSCGGGSNDKQAELEKLKAEQKEINEKIKTLQAELAKDKPKDNSKATIVQTTEVSNTPFSHYLEVRGRIDSDKNVMLTAKSPGTITKVYVTEGQQVQKGKILAQVESTIIEQGIAELKTNLDFATNMYKKQEKLWEQKIGTEVQYLQAKSTKESLESKMASLKEQLENTRIIAPFSGTIDEVNIREGEVAAPGVPAIRIVNPSEFEVMAEIAEAYITKVKEGNPVVVYIPDLKDTVKSKISNVSNVINRTNRSFTVEVDLPEALSKSLKANMIALLNIEDYKNKEAVVVPINVVQHSETDGEYVFVAVDGKAEKRTIKTGQTYGNYAEVLSGLSAGDKVIVTGYQDLVDQQAIAFN